MLPQQQQQQQQQQYLADTCSIIAVVAMIAIAMLDWIYQKVVGREGGRGQVESGGGAGEGALTTNPVSINRARTAVVLTTVAIGVPSQDAIATAITSTMIFPWSGSSASHRFVSQSLGFHHNWGYIMSEFQ